MSVKRQYQTCAILLGVVLALALFASAAWAEATGDASGSDAVPGAVSDVGSGVGSITLLMTESAKDADSAMRGGQIALYCVATTHTAQGMTYDLEGGQFGSSRVVADIPHMSEDELDDQNFRIASDLEKELAEHDVKPLQTTDVTGGKVSFASVEKGLYLVIQVRPSESGQSMGPFLISVPDPSGELNVVSRPKPGVSGKDDQKVDIRTGGQNGSASPAASVGLRVPATADRSVAVFFPVALGFVLIMAGVLVAGQRRRAERVS